MSGMTIAPDGRLRFDGLEARLGAVLLDTVTSCTFEDPLYHSGGVPVQDIPSGGPQDYVPLAILDANNRMSEIVHLRQYTQGTVSAGIERGKEGTTPKTHPNGAKVVHAATVMDYIVVQDHASDQGAHHGVIQAAANAAIKAHLTAHENDPNVDPHPVYVRRDEARLTTVEVTETLLIRPNAKLVVQGDLVVEGRLIVNGYEIVVGPTSPTRQPDNLVWIQTVT